MNYRLIREGSLGTDILRTDEEPDDYEVFKTFAKAKSAMIKHLEAGALNWKIALAFARSLKKEEIK